LRRWKTTLRGAFYRKRPGGRSRLLNGF
jgi:hypothetical protein